MEKLCKNKNIFYRLKYTAVFQRKYERRHRSGDKEDYYITLPRSS
jgi:hypothetical protein